MNTIETLENNLILIKKQLNFHIINCQNRWFYHFCFVDQAHMW